MKINKNLKSKVDELIETKETNITIADMLFALYSYTEIKPENNTKEAVFAEILKYFEIPEDDEESISILNEYVYENLSELNPKEYEENEYFKSIKPFEIKEKNYSLKYLSYKPYQLFASNEILVNNFPYVEKYQVGYFKDEFKYLAILKNNTVWMSLNPNEINTMKPFIQDSKGNVLVLGLGLGYVAFMMSLKKDVKKITIVEKDKAIIDLFNKYLLPNFKEKSKIKVVYDDALRYLENNNKFDYVFADLWHNPEDGISIYLSLKKIAKKHKISINYWLNDSLKAMKRRCLITILQEHFMGFIDKDYQVAKDQMDQVINHLYKENKSLEINTVEEMKRLLD